MESTRTLVLFMGSPGGHDPTGGHALPAGVEVTIDSRRFKEANAVVFHVPTLPRWWWPPRKRKGQIWIAESMESEANYPRLADARFLARFDFTMTYRLDSDVSVPYFEYYSSASNLARVMRDPPRPKTQASPAVSFVSSGHDKSRRQSYLQELSQHLTIDSYGAFMRTHRLQPDKGRPSKLEAISAYRFNLAFENSVDRDYVTEKFFDPLAVGSVPVYLGAPNVEDFAPGERCFVDVRSFGGPKKLAEYLIHVANDAAEYETYFAWKEKPFRARFEKLLMDFGAPPISRLCERVQERLERLGRPGASPPGPRR